MAGRTCENACNRNIQMLMIAMMMTDVIMIIIMVMIMTMIAMNMIMVMCRIYWRGRLVGDNCFEYKFSQRQ